MYKCISGAEKKIRFAGTAMYFMLPRQILLAAARKRCEKDSLGILILFAESTNYFVINNELFPLRDVSRRETISL